MFHEKVGNDYLLRLEKNEEVLDSIQRLCQKEHILSATFQGIGACDDVIISTYIPEKNDFVNHEKTGMLEMVSLMGNVRLKDNQFDQHAHASFSFLEEGKVNVLAGHLAKARISYTAEIRLTPIDGKVTLTLDEKTVIDVWNLKQYQ